MEDNSESIPDSNFEEHIGFFKNLTLSFSFFNKGDFLSVVFSVKFKSVEVSFIIISYNDYGFSKLIEIDVGFEHTIGTIKFFVDEQSTICVGSSFDQRILFER